MERLWSPWRSQHIERLAKQDGDDSGSVFARIASETCDEENLVLWRGERVFVVMNRFPYNNGHLLIVPLRQVEHYEDLTPDEQIEMAHVTEYCIRWLRTALNPEGFNVGMNLGAAAGAGVPTHLHVHVVPRWSADTNFMTSVADVKVIPEAMRDTYRKLRAAVEDFERGDSDSSQEAVR